jgi:hypothetical protein
MPSGIAAGFSLSWRLFFSGKGEKQPPREEQYHWN